LAHGGDTAEMLLPGYKVSSPFDPTSSGLPHEFSIDEINRIITSFVEGVQRSIKAGIDGVEIHAAHGTNLLSRFLSPASNHRHDLYAAVYLI
jgi:2,4-dienoyl-CoA reductase-like NADH-dependent reductase (Old Yellow Enzyme family)